MCTPRADSLAVQQKLTQHGKASILQFLKKNVLYRPFFSACKQLIQIAIIKKIKFPYSWKFMKKFEV